MNVEALADAVMASAINIARILTPEERLEFWEDLEQRTRGQASIVPITHGG